MKRIVIWIPGTPVPFTMPKNKKGGGRYMDPDYREWRKRAESRATEMYLKHKSEFGLPHTGPVSTHFRFCFVKPENAHVCHVLKPDLSNLIKGIEDACSKIIYADDCQIFEHTGAEKKWVNSAADEGAEISITLY